MLKKRIEVNLAQKMEAFMVRGYGNKHYRYAVTLHLKSDLFFNMLVRKKSSLVLLQNARIHWQYGSSRKHAYILLTLLNPTFIY